MRPLLIVWLVVASAVCAVPVAAQTGRPAERTALAHVASRSGAEAVVTGVSRSGRSGLTYVYLRPAVGGVEVVDDPALVVVDGAGAVVYARGTVEAGAVESDAERLGPAE
ncbi:MAG TPA: hypothetical protein VGB53_02465, partial [Rubricoccaceae bacterium]